MSKQGIRDKNTMLLKRYGEKEIIPVYVNRYKEVKQVLAEIQTDDVCIEIEVLKLDFQLWFEFITFVQENSVDTCKSRETEYFAMFEITKSKLSIEIFNELLADLTVCFLDEASIAGYNLRLRRLEMCFIKAWLELFITSMSFGSGEDVLKAEAMRPYLNKLNTSLDEELFDLVFVLYVFSQFDEYGWKLPVPTAHVRFSVEELVDYVARRMSN